MYYNILVTNFNNENEFTEKKILGGRNVKELAKEYKLSFKILNQRVTELKDQKAELALQPYSSVREGKIEELRLRLKPLNAMLSDLKAVAKEVENYYDRSWWRSETFTLNQR